MASTEISTVRAAFLALARELHARGWCPHDTGSVTLRVSPGRFLCTPARRSFGALVDADLVVLDLSGEHVSGVRTATPALPFHLEAHRRRPDVGAVAIALPPAALGASVAGVPLLPTLVADAVVVLGTEIPALNYCTPGARDWAKGFDAALVDADALVLAQRGVMTMGPDLESTLLRMETVEHLAQVQIAAERLGGARELPASDVQELLKRRRARGWGRAGRHDAQARARAELPVVKPKPATPNGLVGVRTFAPPRSQRL